MIRTFSTIYTCVFLILSVPLSAQVYNVTRYSTQSGLIQSQVMTMMQDRRGYLWLGTHRGISRFDGNKFSSYGAENGLVGTFLSSIIEDKNGYIWVGSDAGLSRFDGYRFQDFSKYLEITDKVVETLMEDREGNIWIGTKSSGIILYQGEKFIVNPFPWPGENGKNILSFLEDHSGKVWIGTTQGLFVKDHSSEIRALREFPFSDDLEVFSLAEDASGAVWIGTSRGVFRYYEAQTEHFDLLKRGFPDNHVYCLITDPHQQVWMGTGKGIVRYHQGEFYPLVSNDRMLDFQMRSALVDYEGNLWFGTDGGGVRKITEGVFETLDMDDDLSSNLAKSFLQDRRGNIWISTKDRGINVFDGKKVVRKYQVADGLGGNDICSSFRDSKGNFWFSSYNGTLTRYDGSRFRVFNRAQGLECNAAYCVTEDMTGKIWVGTDNGIFVWEGNGSFTRYSTEQGLPDNTIYSFTTDSVTGDIWIGTSLGLCRFSNDKFSPMDSAVSIGNNVITLLRDIKGRLWVGSAEGLSCVVGNTDYRVRISETPGAHTVVGLIMEKGRFLWVATENGAYRLDLNSFSVGGADRARFEHYTQKDGLPSLECNANAAFLDDRGNIWLGTAEGAISKPVGTQRDEKDYPPRIYITEVRSAADTNWAQALFMPEKSGVSFRPPQLAPNDNRVDFEFIGISLKSSQQLIYKYRLEGLTGQDWDSLPGQTRVSYAHLDPGDYTFQVIAKKEADDWDYSNPASFSFFIRYPVHQTWWFILLMSLLALSVASGVYWVFWSRRKQQIEEQKIRDTAEKLQLEHQALYAMMNPHFTFNALQSIQYFIHRQDKISANKFLSSFAKLIRKNLESTKSDFISLGEEIERLKLYLSLEKMRFPEKFDYVVNVGPGIELSETQIPPMLLQPFVENSIKHGIMPLDANGMIEVNLSRKDEDHLLITISDNGIGIEASRKQRADRPNDHVSKGMQITLDRLALFARMTRKKHSLDIHEIVDPEGKILGTMVEMLLPVKQW
ncbi:MAG: two-component regulator propeller domain-containing protein [Bacteroidia bacterium]|nr:two-component regulator propeller domain-containing protein [Bacteroidia bacterium]